ncbi:hypothetical protein Tco_1204322 [Tanacetum coccineum]
MYLTEVIPFFKTLKEHFAGVQTALFKEVKVMEEIFDQMNDEVDQNTVDKQCAEIERKNLLIANENLIANCLSNQLLYDVEKSRCLDLETEMSKVQNEIKHVSKLEREYLNLQIKIEDQKAQSKQFESWFARSSVKYKVLLLELVEYVIGTCPKEFTERDSKAPSIPLTRKKQVTFTDTCSTSTNNTQKHGVHQKTQPSNVQVIPSTGKVEDHPRTNKSVWTKVNRVDSSISSKHVVINLNSESVCKTCNKCLNSANHEMCVVNILSFVNATPTVKIVLNKGKQIWKPKGKLSDNSLNKTKQIWQPKGKLSDNSLNKTKQVVQIILWYLDSSCSKLDLEEWMALVRISSGPEPFMMTPRQLNSGLATSHVPATTNIPLTDKDLEILFQSMFDEYFVQSTDSEPVPMATVVKGLPNCTSCLSSGVCTEPTIEDTSITQADLHPSVNPVEREPSSAQSTSGDVSLAKPHQVNQPPDHLIKWSRDHPLDNIIGNPSRPVSTRKQLASDALW